MIVYNILVPEEEPLMAPQSRSQISLLKKVKDILSKTPGLSIKEIAELSKVDRHFMAGFLKALEEKGEVCSRKVGAAKIYFNNEEGGKK